jgi:hypothetical protein
VAGYKIIEGKSRHLLDAISVKNDRIRNGKSKWRKFDAV